MFICWLHCTILYSIQRRHYGLHQLDQDTQITCYELLFYYHNRLTMVSLVTTVFISLLKCVTGKINYGKTPVNHYHHCFYLGWCFSKLHLKILNEVSSKIFCLKFQYTYIRVLYYYHFWHEANSKDIIL